MKVLHINKHSSGGAFNAAFRQHQALLAADIESFFLTLGDAKVEISNHLTYQKKKTGYVRRVINNLGPFKTKRNHHLNLLNRNNAVASEIFTFPDTDIDLVPLVEEIAPDVINLHWVGNFLDVATFFKKIKLPIVWTLHDMNPFLGGFHYNLVDRDEEKSFEALERRNIEIKRQGYTGNIHIVSPSRWLLNASLQSELLGRYSHTYIPYSLPVDVFYPRDRSETRQELGLPLDKRILLFVAEKVGVRRKGVEHLEEAFSYLQSEMELRDVEIIAVGNKSEHLDKYPFVHQHGYVHGMEEMAKFYSSADAFIMPSLMDNLPNVMLESIACGTPVLAYDIGGVPDAIKHGENGLLAKKTDGKQLAGIIMEFFQKSDQFDRLEISILAHKNYHASVQGQLYKELYQRALEANPN